MSREESLQTLLEEIVRVFKGMAASCRFGVDEQKLTRPQICILMLLSKKKEGVAVKDLAKKFNVTSGAITQFIDSLVEKGLVKREEDQSDRRTIKIKLSESGKNKFKNFKKNYFKSLNPMFDSLKNDEIKKLRFLLSKVTIPSNSKRCEI